MQTPGQEETHRERDHEHVVEARPYQVGPNLGKDSATEIQRSNDIKEVGPHEDNVGCFDGNGGTGRESDSERCCDEGWGIVDPVTNLAVQKED